jgi:hypothetical protein
LAADKQGFNTDIYKLGKVYHAKLKATLGLLLQNALRL